MLVDLHPPMPLFNMKSNTREHKVVVIGPRKVGKSALVVRFLTKRFISEYVENTDMQCIRVADIDGEPLKVHIQDTSDKAMRNIYLEHKIKWADAIMLVYSITDPAGFSQLKYMADRIMQRNRGFDEREQSSLPPMVLVGNMGDLDFLRKISQREGLELAAKMNCDFFEASAREGWSKLITKRRLSSPLGDPDSLSLLAGATGSVGALGLPNMDVSREFVRSLTPTLRRRKSNTKAHHSDNEHSTDLTPVKRWGSFNSLNRLGDGSGSNKSIQKFSPFPSDDDSEDLKLSRLSPTTRGRKTHSHSFMCKLSPNLSRRLNRTLGGSSNNLDRKHPFRGDNNNNNNFRTKDAPNSIACGLSTTLLTTFGESLCSTPPDRRSSSQSTDISSNGNSVSSSDSESREKLLFDDGNDNAVLIKNKSESDSRLKGAPLLVEPFRIEERDFSSSEPFLNICRGKTSRSRIRSRSPTHMIVNSFKKIRSRSDHHNSTSTSVMQKSNHHYSNTSNLLSVPVIKF